MRIPPLLQRVIVANLKMLDYSASKSRAHNDGYW